MSFTHEYAKVTNIEPVDKYTGLTSADNTDLSNHTLFTTLGNLVVRKELKQFADDLLKISKDFRFGVNSDNNSEWTNTQGGSIRFMMDVWVYLPGERFARGRIGYGTFRLNARRSGDCTYMVMSRRIRNEKYDSGREQYHMAITNTYNNALKSARTHLVAYSVPEMAGVEHKHITRPVSKKKYDVANATYRGVRDLSVSSMVNEFSVLVDSGYKFVDASFDQKIREIVEANKEAKAEANKKCHAYYVSIRQVGDEQYADIAEAFDIGNDGEWGKPKFGEVTTVLAQDVPYDIAGKVAVLSMNEPDHYVEGVGVKIDDTGFWVERDVVQQ